MIARERARALGNVGEKLIDLERVALLLLELIVLRSVLGLLRLLLDRAGGDLGVRALEASGLCA